MKGLDSTKFLEILKSNKTPNKFSTDQLKIAFKHKNFVREPFQICSKIRIPLHLKHLNCRTFRLFYITSTQTIYFNHKLNSLSRFATLRAISNLLSSFLYTLYKHFKLILNVFSRVRRWNASLFTITRQICIKYPQKIKLHLLFFPKFEHVFDKKNCKYIFKTL